MTVLQGKENSMKKKPKFTGLLDANCKKIFEGDLVWAGMRRGDPRGWTLERVVWLPRDKEWGLQNHETDERMQMQWDQELRGKVSS
jgi:hypothetical protein